MHLIVDNMPHLSKVNWVDDLVIPIFFIAVKILSLPAVACSKSASGRSPSNKLPTRVVEKERVIRTSILHQPVHCPEDVLLRRLAHWVLLVVGKNDHIVALIAEILV